MTDTPDHRSAPLGLWIARLEMRSTLNDRELAAIAQLPFEKAEYDANRDFVRLGDDTNSACVIVSGLAGRFDQTASGARQITALHIPGDAADLHSTPLPKADCALQALTRTTVAHIPHAALSRLVADYPAIAMAFWRDCVVDAAILSRWTLNIGRTSARQRVGHLLCELALRYAAIGLDPLRFALPATQVHLGDATGLTNVHINRTLKALVDDGLAVFRSGQVRILDWPALARDADFDARYLHQPDRIVARAASTQSGASSYL